MATIAKKQLGNFLVENIYCEENEWWVKLKGVKEIGIARVRMKQLSYEAQAHVRESVRMLQKTVCMKQFEEFYDEHS